MDFKIKTKPEGRQEWPQTPADQNFRDYTYYQHRHKKGFNLAPGEALEIGIAWLILSLAFGILYSNNDIDSFKLTFPISLATVGLGFILHELGHKYLAQHYGLEAIFKANYRGLVWAVFLSLAGFILVTPGGVFIRGQTLTRQQHGKIALTGPLMNLLLGVGFLAIYLNPYLNIRILSIASLLGYKINAWISLFNMIPAQGFDGKKILEWNVIVYALMAALTGGMYLLSYTLKG
ncbi:MAG: hypothetical protein PHG85_02085 [Candidatus Altiarchaeota archaeon]|nr:hypothetical protein [Candidatus Altiarchaeota archaeon]